MKRKECKEILCYEEVFFFVDDVMMCIFGVVIGVFDVVLLVMLGGEVWFGGNVCLEVVIVLLEQVLFDVEQKFGIVSFVCIGGQVVVMQCFEFQSNELLFGVYLLCVILCGSDNWDWVFVFFEVEQILVFLCFEFFGECCVVCVVVEVFEFGSDGEEEYVELLVFDGVFECSKGFVGVVDVSVCDGECVVVVGFCGFDFLFQQLIEKFFFVKKLCGLKICDCQIVVGWRFEMCFVFEGFQCFFVVVFVQMYLCEVFVVVCKLWVGVCCVFEVCDGFVGLFGEEEGQVEI